jgi:hypothetical protein
MDRIKELLLGVLVEVLDKLVSGEELQQKLDVWMIARLRELAASTENEVDDKIVELVAKAVGVPQERA